MKIKDMLQKILKKEEEIEKETKEVLNNENKILKEILKEQKD